MAVKIKVLDNQKLAELIYRNGFSVQSFARESGLSDTTIQTMIDGERDGCSPDTSKRILATLEPFGTKFDDIFFIVHSSKSKIMVTDEHATTLEATGTDGKRS